MKIPSRLLKRAVEQFSTLPGIGKKSALRFVLHLLKESEQEVDSFIDSIYQLKKNIHLCKECYNISDNVVCDICSDSNREQNTLCIVEDIRDVMAIENTLRYKGKYHILGGLISPMDGIGPDDIKIEELISRIETQHFDEIIMALSPTMEGDTTCFYLYKKLKGFDLKVTTLSKGVSVGDSLEYADELTLGNSIINRLPYNDTVSYN